jgi:rhodanese-related sulfurtransferase
VSPRPAGARSIDEILAAARARLDRVTAEQAHLEVRDGDGILVDIRPAWQRADEGEVPGALVVERNHLEWRFDPEGGSRLPQASYDARVLVFCSEGYTSSLAAAALHDLGVRRATDVDGGFHAWRAAGLPVTDTVSDPVPPPQRSQP